MQVALLRDLDVPGVLALQELAAGEAGAGVGEHAHLVGAAVAGQLGEGAGEEQVAGGGRDVASRGGHDGRPAAAQRGGVEHVVVDERGRMDELHGHGGAQDAVVLRGAVAGGEEDEQRAQPLAAGADRRARVRGEDVAVRGGELLEALLEPLP